MKHSPGPWTIDTHDLVEDQWSIVSKPRMAFVASITYHEPDEDDTPDTMPTIQEVKANARLIAAAPELLEALINLLLCTQITTNETQQKAILFALKTISKTRSHVK